MIRLELTTGRSPLRVLCIGAHSDDIEIGCLGSILRWRAEQVALDITWAVLSGDASRIAETRGSVKRLRTPKVSIQVVHADLRDAHFPAEYAKAKEVFATLARTVRPQVILSHRLEDRHQDHRMVGELTWQTWRDHLILEYEIPKYEGDLGQPNVFVQLPKSTVDRKVKHLLRHFGSQRSKSWFTSDSFVGLMRGRGIECRSESGFAEAFTARKICL